MVESSNKEARFDSDKLNELAKNLNKFMTNLERLRDGMKELEDEDAALEDKVAAFHNEKERTIELVTMSPPRFIYNLVTGKIKR